MKVCKHRERAKCAVDMFMGNKSKEETPSGHREQCTRYFPHSAGLASNPGVSPAVRWKQPLHNRPKRLHHCLGPVTIVCLSIFPLLKKNVFAVSYPCFSNVKEEIISHHFGPQVSEPPGTICKDGKFKCLETRLTQVTYVLHILEELQSPYWTLEDEVAATAHLLKISCHV